MKIKRYRILEMLAKVFYWIMKKINKKYGSYKYEK